MIPSLVILTFLLASLPGEAAIGPGDSRAALLEQLRVAYPGVQRWEIREVMVDESRSEGDRTPERITVSRLGPRSSVVAESRDMAGRVIREQHWFSVAGFEPVLVAARDLSRGSTVTADAVHVEERDLFGRECQRVTDVTTLRDQVLRRSIAGGASICRQFMAPMPAVGRGDRVRVHYTIGAVTLVAAAVAEQAGLEGDVVRVRNPDSRETFRAVVTGPKEVFVHE